MPLPLALLEPIFRPIPPFAGGRIRTQALRAAGFSIGHGSGFWGWPTIVGSGNFASRLRVGAYCGFNVRCYFELEAPVTLADHVSVGHEVMFLTAKHEAGDGNRRAGPVQPAPIIVEEGAWIGARAVIMPGVRVGAGAVIGASVVVSEDIPAQTMVVGTQKISLARWR